MSYEREIAEVLVNKEFEFEVMITVFKDLSQLDVGF
jgi:hypothetical protein